MTAGSKINFKSVDSRFTSWHKVLTLTLAFWLSSNLLLDFVIMPSLSASGMLAQAEFVPAGYGLFWVFNRLEMLCAAIVVTGVLVQQQASKLKGKHNVVLLSLLMLAVTFLCTYFLTPQMSSLGVQLNLFEPALETPAGMNQLHLSYWIVETIKIISGGILLSWCLQTSEAKA